MTATMRITVLAVPDCPNAPVAAGRITAALAGRPASVELVEITEEAEAGRVGMTGSPAILLDGVDPFAVAGAVPSVSCRIYRGSDGAAGGAPSVQVTAALSAAGLPAAAGYEGCCHRIRPGAGCAGAGRRPVRAHCRGGAGRARPRGLPDPRRRREIRAAFSATQTPHRVRITGGAEVWSMCAIDALGITAWPLRRRGRLGRSAASRAA